MQDGVLIDDELDIHQKTQEELATLRADVEHLRRGLEYIENHEPVPDMPTWWRLLKPPATP
jgi:hypothetical protein